LMLVDLRPKEINGKASPGSSRSCRHHREQERIPSTPIPSSNRRHPRRHTGRDDRGMREEEMLEIADSGRRSVAESR
jgi:hypothetical protein